MSTTTSFTESVTRTISDAQAKAFDVLAESQETAVKALDSWTEFLTAQTSSLRSGNLIPSFEGFSADTPLLGQVFETMPSVTELVDKSFAAAEDVLAKQRELAVKLAASTDQMVHGLSPAKAERSTAKK